MRFRVVDRSNNEATDSNPTLVANAKLNGIFDQISAPLVDGLCNAFFTCMDNNLKAEASNCDIVS
jgi:hypothetical protein